MKSNIEFLYEELRKATDGGSESMTHDDALKQIAYWRDKCSQAQAVEPIGYLNLASVKLPGEKHLACEFSYERNNNAAAAIPLYIHPAPPPAGERAELIAGIKHELAEFAHNKTLETLLLDAADMLESDAQAMSNLLARIHRDDGHYESEHGQIKAVGDADLIVAKLNALSDAQQVAVPMTEAQIFECDPVPHVMFDQQRIDFARAIEAHCKPKAQGAKPVAQQVAVPMTDPEIISTAYDCNALPEVMTDAGLLRLVRAIEQHHGIGAKP